ncbi:Rad51d [Ramazzottius varieornatus]|uniref:DNA repair protein RAD51 homolog 3 n=1 Tax=Ramazzottius varieornatus TaxID=947166 RepID=A0A1D1VHD5_RAMVA|nr:Rad51d [Ramazzottius varieornatus]
MDRDIGQVPLEPAIRTKLLKLGYGKIDSFTDLADAEILALSAKLQMSLDETKSIIEQIRSYRGSVLPDYVSVLRGMDLLLKSQSNLSITTGSTRLDDLLDGGIQIGQLTEISGAPGIGKTQLCFQLCVNVQIPKVLNGLEGGAVFIDTDGSFVEKRVTEMALAMLEELNRDQTENCAAPPEELPLERILDNITIFRCRDYREVIKTVNVLPAFLKYNQHVRLIVMDSVVSPFRYAFEDMAERSKVLNSVTQKLISIATTNQLAVVLANQVTTKFGPSGEDGHIVPALGASWGHSCGTRVILFLKDNIRTALLFKSPTKGETLVPFSVTPAGIKDYLPKNSSMVSSGPKKRLHEDEPMPEAGDIVASLADISHLAEDEDQITFEDFDAMEAVVDFEEQRDEV